MKHILSTAIAMAMAAPAGAEMRLESGWQEIGTIVNRGHKFRASKKVCNVAANRAKNKAAKKARAKQRKAKK